MDKHLFLVQSCECTVYKKRKQSIFDFLRQLPPVGVIVASQMDLEPTTQVFESEAEALATLKKCANDYSCSSTELWASESWVEECIIHDYEDFASPEEAIRDGYPDYCGWQEGLDVPVRVTVEEKYSDYKTVYDRTFKSLPEAVDAYCDQQEAYDVDDYDFTLWLGDSQILS